LLVNIFITVITASLTSIVAYVIASRKFRSEKLWLKKFEAYESLFESLFHCKRYSDKYVATFKNVRRRISDEDSNRLSEKYDECQIEIERAIAIGGFLFSANTNNILNMYETEESKNNHSESWEESVINSQEILDRTIAKLVKSAKSDLSESSFKISELLKNKME